MNTYHHHLSQAEKDIKEKQFEKAENTLLSSVQENPNGHEAYFLLGSLYHHQGKFDKAIDAYKKALFIKPNYTDAALSLSILYNDLGKYEEGKFMFHRAQKEVSSKNIVQDSYINEQLAQKHIEFGSLYEVYHRFLDADQEYQKALKLCPDDPDILIRMAKTHEKQGSLHQALKILKQLKESKPNYIPALIRLGLVHYAQGHMIEAIREWENVLYLDPKNSEALMYLEMSQKATTTTL